MASSGSTVDAILVLDQDYLDVVDVEEVGGPAIGIEFLLVDLKSYPRRIVVAFGAIIDRAHDTLALGKLHRDSITDIGGEGGNAALARKMVSDKCYLLDE
jgi:hypothetical protein